MDLEVIGIQLIKYALGSLCTFFSKMGNSVWVGGGLNQSQQLIKKFLETMSNFWLIGAGGLKLGRLAVFLQGF